MPLKEIDEELREKVRVIEGIPPHNTPANIAWHDAYAYGALVRDYGEKVVKRVVREEMEKWKKQTR